MELIAFAEDILEAQLRGVLPRLSRETEVTHVTGNGAMLVRCRRVEHLCKIRRITQSTEIRDSTDDARRSSEVGNVLAVASVARIGKIAWDVEIVVIQRRIYRISKVLMHHNIGRTENREIVGIVRIPYVIDGLLRFLPAVGIDDRLCPKTLHLNRIERNQLCGDPALRVSLNKAADRLFDYGIFLEVFCF